VSLRYCDSGGVVLGVVDEHGKFVSGSNIAYLRTNGTLGLMDSIDPEIGLSLNKHGRIKCCPVFVTADG